MSPRISFVQQFEQQQAETGGLRFSLDGKRLVSTDDTALYLWRLIERRGWGYEQSLPIRHARRPSFAFALRLFTVLPGRVRLSGKIIPF